MAVWAKPASGKKTGRNPTDRGKSGTKKSLAVEADGGPLGVVIAGANVPDVQLLEETLEAIVVDRPEVTEEEPQNLCLDKGYDQPLGHEVIEQTDYTPHIRPRREKKKKICRARTNAIPPDAGSSNVPWPGSKSVVGS